jgi:hypothetical protein
MVRRDPDDVGRAKAPLGGESSGAFGVRECLAAGAGIPPGVARDARNENGHGPQERAQDHETEGDGSGEGGEDRGPEQVVHAEVIGFYHSLGTEPERVILRWFPPATTSGFGRSCDTRSAQFGKLLSTTLLFGGGVGIVVQHT